MPQLVTHGALLQCAAGAAPSALSVVPPNVAGETNPAANIQDFIPMTNIQPFGNCKILTAAAAGAPTPCAPATSPWTNGSTTVMVRGMPALHAGSMCNCSVGGVITVNMPGTAKVAIT
jgi:uncharacterized Zn-binding protein involved in type VI secretion